MFSTILKASTAFAMVAMISTAAMACPCQEGGQCKRKDGGHHGKMFDKMDTDGNGIVTKDEFTTKTMEKFSTMDADGDGNVTKEEAQAHREQMREKWKEKRKERMGEQENESNASE